ncbi:MAG: hypothetical protein DLM57_17765 [Pseudonocardiales bacterium]|nr:MAG: hypothetical protein DLM57_17765 [Pseudonocardiales bacterium]
MSRRTTLPGAAELFRTTSAVPEADSRPTPVPHPGVGAVPPVREISADPADHGNADRSAPGGGARPAVRTTRRIRAVGDRAPSGRERHEEKITVYCSPDELLDLESARLNLRAEHGLAIDRGRIVREALAVVLADLEAKGDASILVRRLREP